MSTMMNHSTRSTCVNIFKTNPYSSLIADCCNYFSHNRSKSSLLHIPAKLEYILVICFNSKGWFERVKCQLPNSSCLRSWLKTVSISESICSRGLGLWGLRAWAGVWTRAPLQPAGVLLAKLSLILLLTSSRACSDSLKQAIWLI